MGAAVTAVQAPAAQSVARPVTGRRAVTLAAVYYLLAALAVTLWLWRDPASRTVAGNPNDADQYTWFFRYDATAIAHGHLPALVTTAMNAPQGVNAMWNTFMLLPGILLAPVTLLFGPQSALTLFMTAGFAGSATAMFAVLRRWQVSVGSAALAGAVYAFSPALLHSAIGHYDLQFAVFPPLIIDAGLALATGRASAVRGGIWLGLLVTAQLFITEEMLFFTAVAGVILVVVLAASRPRAVSGQVRTVAGGLGVAGCVTAVIAGYPLWVQFFGPLYQHGSPFTLSYFETDLRGFYVPSHLLWLTSKGSSAFAASYVPGAPEYLAYLGIPLLVIAPLAGIARISDPRARLLLGTGAIFALFSLGGTLLDNGHQTAVRLPWGLVENWPVFGAALPDRFAIVVALAAAGLLAMGVGWLLDTGRARGRILAALLAAACVAPLLPRPYPVTTAAQAPPFFAAAGRWLSPGSTVLVLPYPTASQTQPLVWQAAAQMAFRMPGGYFIGPASGGEAYVGGPGPTAVAATLIEIQLGVPAPPVTPSLRASFWQDMSYWGAHAIVAGPGARAALTGFIQGLVRRPPLRTGGVLLWRHLP